MRTAGEKNHPAPEGGHGHGSKNGGDEARLLVNALSLAPFRDTVQSEENH